MCCWQCPAGSTACRQRTWSAATAARPAARRPAGWPPAACPPPTSVVGPPIAHQTESRQRRGPPPGGVPWRRRACLLRHDAELVLVQVHKRRDGDGQLRAAGGRAPAGSHAGTTSAPGPARPGRPPRGRAPRTSRRTIGEESAVTMTSATAIWCSTWTTCSMRSGWPKKRPSAYTTAARTAGTGSDSRPCSGSAALSLPGRQH